MDKMSAIPSLTACLNNELPEPFDLASFRKFCEKEHTNENVDFLLAIQRLRATANVVDFAACLQGIQRDYLRQDSPESINIPGDMRSRTLKAIADALPTLSIDALPFHILDAPQASIFELIRSDPFQRYVNKITVATQVELSIAQALWWKSHTITGMPGSATSSLTVRDFFSFPNPVDTADSRLHAICGMVLIALTILLDQLTAHGKYIVLYMCAGYLLRSLCGPRLDPQAFIVLFLLRPLFVNKLRLMPHNFVPGMPRRLAQIVALCFSVTGAVLLLAFPQHWIPAYAVLGCLFLANLLSGPFDFCLVCWGVGCMVRKKWLPASVCADCSVAYINVSVAGRSTNKKTKDSAHVDGSHMSTSALSVNSAGASAINLEAGSSPRKNASMQSMTNVREGGMDGSQFSMVAVKNDASIKY